MPKMKAIQVTKAGAPFVLVECDVPEPGDRQVRVKVEACGKQVAGWPSGSAIDSEDTMAFSAMTGVRPRVEVTKLDQAEAAFTRMMENRVRFRGVLTP